jgi:hypothetical protein
LAIAPHILLWVDGASAGVPYILNVIDWSKLIEIIIKQGH